MAGLSTFLKPSSYKDWVLRHVAKFLRPYLARTPLVWGEATNLTLGRNVQLADVIINVRSGRVCIGDHAFFGHGVMLLSGTHDMQLRGADRHTGVPAAGRDIIIGTGAWIASGSIIIGPCTIGDNTVVGAGSVVIGDLAANSFYAGNPAKLIRSLA